MPIATLMILLTTFAEPDVTVTMLDGPAQTGTLGALSSSAVSLSGPDGDKSVKLADVVEVRIQGEPQQPIAGPRVFLTDGSTLAFKSLEIESQRATIETAAAGRVRVPLTTIQAVRFRDGSSSLNGRWNELRDRPTTRDVIVFPKKTGDDLEYTKGVAGAVRDGRVAFVVEGEEIGIRTDRLFGLVYSRSEAEQFDPLCELALRNGDRLQVDSIRLADEHLDVTLISGVKLSTPVAMASLADFSAGKIVYLSDMEPVAFDYRPFVSLLDVETEKAMFRFRRNTTMDGRALRLGGNVYERGLWIHSRSRLIYDIDEDFRRFQALMGIDDDRALARPGRGHVHVVISGDGKPLFESDVRWSDDPVVLDLDVVDVRELEILVDFGDEGDISDWLDLVNARVVK